VAQEPIYGLPSAPLPAQPSNIMVGEKKLSASEGDILKPSPLPYEHSGIIVFLEYALILTI